MPGRMNRSASAVTASTEEGIHEAYILPSQYTSIATVEGIPISTFVSGEVTKALTSKSKWLHSLVFGVSGRTSSNKGAGRKSGISGFQNFYTLDQGEGSQIGYRDYDFNRTRTESQISVYFEDRIYKKFEKNRIFNLDFGLRYENQAGNVALQPRINSSYSINKTFRFRGGFGSSSKAPSLAPFPI